MNKEELKQYIDDNIYENQDGEITGEALNEVLKAIVDDGGTEVEANPTGEATTPLTKIKIGETNYNIPQTDTSNLATKQELQQGLSGKQDTINDLSTIRSGAAAGATAYQKPSSGIQASDLSNDVQASLGKADTSVQQVTVGTTTTGAAGSNASVTNSGTSTAPVLDFTIPRGADGSDAVNPFKGWFDAVVTGEAGSRVITSETQNLPSNPIVGDYAYVKTWDISGTAPSQTETPIVKIYECSTAGSWSDSGRTADTSNVQTFASGQEVNEVGIDSEPTIGSNNVVKSSGVAEAIKAVGEIVQVQDNTYLYLLLDKDNKIIAGIKHDATLVFNSNIELNSDVNVACENIAFESPVEISGEPINFNNNLSIRDNEIDYIDSLTELYAIVDSNGHVLLSISEDGTVYLPKIKSQTIDDKLDKTHDVLYGKKWVVIGDSFTNGAGVGNITEKGKYYGSTANYAYIIGNRYDMDIVRFFDGGRTLAFPAIPEDFVNSITNPTAAYYYQKIPSDADYVTIYLGINDAHHAPGSSGGDGEDNTGEIPLGTPTDATTATFYGAWNVVLSWLRENRPFAHVGIIVSNGTGDIAYPQATIEMAKKYGYPYIDLNGDKDTPAMIRSTNPDIPDSVKTAIKNAQMLGGTGGTHPNAAAYRFESKFIESFLKHI